jgi:hypothetical protein
MSNQLPNHPIPQQNPPSQNPPPQIPAAPPDLQRPLLYVASFIYTLGPGDPTTYLDDDCTICLDTWTETPAGTLVVQLDCRHALHGQCLVDWLYKGIGGAIATCPECRKPLCNRPPCRDWPEYNFEAWECIYAAQIYIQPYLLYIEYAARWVWQVYQQQGYVVSNHRGWWCEMILATLNSIWDFFGLHCHEPGHPWEWALINEIINYLRKAARGMNVNDRVLRQIRKCMYKGANERNIRQGYQKAGLGILNRTGR